MKGNSAPLILSDDCDRPIPEATARVTVLEQRWVPVCESSGVLVVDGALSLEGLVPDEPGRYRLQVEVTLPDDQVALVSQELLVVDPGPPLEPDSPARRLFGRWRR